MPKWTSFSQTPPYILLIWLPATYSSYRLGGRYSIEVRLLYERLRIRRLVILVKDSSNLLIPNL
jgi:hypothetical protein